MIGFELWKRPEMNFPRDYLVAMPNVDYTGVSHKIAESTDLAILNELLLSQLRWPSLDLSDGSADSGAEQLVVIVLGWYACGGDRGGGGADEARGDDGGS